MPESLNEDLVVPGTTKGQDGDLVVEKGDDIFKECGPSEVVRPESAGNLSPFDRSGAIREDNSWRNSSPSLSTPRPRMRIL
jgi:hypothetical protein